MESGISGTHEATGATLQKAWNHVLKRLWSLQAWVKHWTDLYAAAKIYLAPWRDFRLGVSKTEDQSSILPYFVLNFVMQLGNGYD